VRILIGYDGSDCAKSALSDLQRAGLPAEAEVLVLTAAEVFIPNQPNTEGAAEELYPQYVPQAVKLAWERNQQQFEEAKKLAAEAAGILRARFPGWKIESTARAETPHWAIISEANELKPDLVVVGSQGRSAVGRIIFGSVSQKVLYECSCSVRIARGRETAVSDPVRLVIGADGSPDADAMLEAIVARKWQKDTEVKLVTVVESFHQFGNQPTAQMDRIREIQSVAEQQLRNAGLYVTPVVKEGDPKQILLDEAESWSADCIFLGAQGLRLLERMLLGSVSSVVAARASCSVEIVRRKVEPNA
jgi:nucleotide-binding universal stress UspA family protein